MAERSETEVRDFLNLAQSRFKLAASSESETRKESLDDARFSIGEQWPLNLVAQRQLDNRPCLKINRLPQFIRQVTNEQRQQRPAIQVNPIGDGADTDTAEILQGIIRHIEVNSGAEEAYDIAFDWMVRIGFGYLRVVTDWISPETEDQEIYIRPIDNPFSVYLDPSNKRDPQWGFNVEDLLADEFKHQFPNSKYAMGMASLSDYESVGDMPAKWVQTVDGEPAIRIAEYFWIERSKGDKGIQKRKVHWSKISALDVLDETLWPGKHIPIIEVLGEDLMVEGKRHIAGLVRHAKDPQRAYNYWISAVTEKIALAPKAPFMADPRQIEGFEVQWKEANVRNTSYLPYNAIVVGGTMIPQPKRDVVDAGIQGMTEMLQLSEQDMQATTGLYPNNLGQKQTTNESGKAVLARQKQGDLATLNYSDNMARGTRRLGQQIIDLIPEVYTSSRIQRIVKPDDTTSMVAVINSAKNPDDNGDDLLAANPNIKKVFDVGTGRYDVAVSVGPSYQSKRQEAVASQMALISAVPQIMPAIGDLVVGNMDWPQSREIAARLKKMLPPQLQDSEDQTPEAQLMQAQQQLAALGQQHAQLVQLVQQQKQVIDTKQVETNGRVAIEQHKSQTQMSIEQMKIDAQIAIAEINTKAQNAQERAKMFVDIWNELHGSAHELAMQQGQQAHEQSLAQQGAMNDQQSQQSDQSHELGMAAVSGTQAENQQAQANQQQGEE